MSGSAARSKTADQMERRLRVAEQAAPQTEETMNEHVRARELSFGVEWAAEDAPPALACWWDWWRWIFDPPEDTPAVVADP